MFNHYYLAFDVGGLFITGGVLNDRGELFPNTESYYPSKSHLDREDLLDHLVDIICRQIGKIMDKYFVIDGIGFAFPGPFDYENGVCYISGVNKFEALYGVDLRAELTARLRKQRVFVNRVSSLFGIIFENNVSMFALGEWSLGKAKNYERVLFLTLGNGTGSAFLDHGELIKERTDIPPNGWVYSLPFRHSIVDDYVSTRGILRIADQLNIDQSLSLEQMADAARSGQVNMKEVFHQFGLLLGEMLAIVITPFQPDAIVIGGQIAKSYDLFKDEVQMAVKNENAIIELSEHTSYSTFIGISKTILKIKAG